MAGQVGEDGVGVTVVNPSEVRTEFEIEGGTFAERVEPGSATEPEEVERILDVGEAETGTRATFREDTHGYHWVGLRDDDFEDDRAYWYPLWPEDDGHPWG